MKCFDEWLQSFTQFACKNLICDREKTDISVLGSYRTVSLFKDRTEDTEVRIVEHIFLLFCKQASACECVQLYFTNGFTNIIF